ncbi:MAG TPA: hypothetical protein VMT16_04785 [Thermoanaerobaculia bacterium]|nr:hypothetical protein [Thermoanaerobaculia bacterium]
MRHILATVLLGGLAAAAAAQSTETRPGRDTAGSEEAAEEDISQCEWYDAASLPGIEVRDLAAAPGDALFLTGDAATAHGGAELVTLRSFDGGGTWEEVDRFVLPGGQDAGAHALEVDADGHLFVLGWSTIDGVPHALIRRSFAAGDPGTWETSEATWPWALLGALDSDGRGRVLLALGFAGPEGVGWRVLSSPRAVGSWRTDDLYQPELPGVTAAVPHDLEPADDGSVLLVGQLEGTPQRWVSRYLPGRWTALRGESREWTTVDLFELGSASYGLAAAAALPLRGGGAVVAGWGVGGGGADDYAWITRRTGPAMGSWVTDAFQLVPGLSAFALDGEATVGGALLLLGVAQHAEGWQLVLQRSEDSGVGWQEILVRGGIANSWSGELTVVEGVGLFVAATARGVTTVLACR